MSELTDLEDAITNACRTIASDWPALTEAMIGGKGGSLGRAPTPLATAPDDEHDEREDDTPRRDRIVSLRRFAVDVLNGWSRVVMEDRPVEHALPDGLSAVSMCEFLMRHAQWLSGHEAAQDCADELAPIARKVHSVTHPQPKDWIYIGDCPNTIGVEGEPVVCEAPIRVYPDRPIRCRSCSMEDTLDGWILRIVGSHQPVTIPQLIPLLHKRLGIVVDERTLRRWYTRGDFEAIDSTAKTPKFNRADVFTALVARDRRKASA